jgi:hypothetical protein
MGRIQKKYNLDLLKEVIERDQIIVPDVDETSHLSSLVYLDFICKCGKPGNKTFRLMFEKGSLCRDCTIILYNERHKASLKKSTGFEYALQNKDILQKKKDTCMKRFNFEHAIQSDIIKEKIKQTCLSRYNCEFVSQVKNVREKIKNTWFSNYGVYNPLQCPAIRVKGIETCLRKYGFKYASQSESIKTKMSDTSMKRYGVKRAIQLPFYKNKKEQTSFKKYGVKNAIQLQSVKDKRIQTSLKRYGVTSSSKLQNFKDKSMQTCLQKYGVKYPSQSEIVKNKRVQTCLQKYGVKYACQARIKYNDFTFKKYTFPCGKISHVQGHEPFALNDLIKEGYTGSDILTCRSEVPDIWYIGSDDKKHRYFVDIYIPKINKMIEVKSDYTYKRYEQTVLLKAEACVNQGYKYEIWIYDAKGNKEIILFELEN